MFLNQHRAEGERKHFFLNPILVNREALGSDFDFSKAIADLNFGALSGPTSPRKEMEVI